MLFAGVITEVIRIIHGNWAQKFALDFLFKELFTSLCDTFQFWQILTASSFSLSSPQPAPEPVLRAQHARTAHKHARQGSFPEHTHARLRLSRALEKSEHWRLSGGEDCGETWLRGNLAASLMSQKKALRIICKIGLRNGERGERVAGDDDG